MSLKLSFRKHYLLLNHEKLSSLELEWDRINLNSEIVKTVNKCVNK